MSNLSDIFGTLETILGTAITGLKAYGYIPDSVNHFPAAIAMLESFEPEVAFSGNSFEGDIRVVFLMSSADSSVGFRALYDYIDPTTGSLSLTKAIRDNGSLGGAVDSIGVTRIENIGRRDIGGGFYFGFDAILHFIKTVA